jgi:hypothetical protein
MTVESNGRVEAGPYHLIQPAEAGTGCYHCPTYKLRDQQVKDHHRVHRESPLKRIKKDT